MRRCCAWVFTFLAPISKAVILNEVKDLHWPLHFLRTSALPLRFFVGAPVNRFVIASNRRALDDLSHKSSPKTPAEEFRRKSSLPFSEISNFKFEISRSLHPLQFLSINSDLSRQNSTTRASAQNLPPHSRAK